MLALRVQLGNTGRVETESKRKNSISTQLLQLPVAC
jgi:hypothetical protein